MRNLYLLILNACAFLAVDACGEDFDESIIQGDSIPYVYKPLSDLSIVPELKLSTCEASLGDEITVDITFRNVAQKPVTVFNPYFCGLLSAQPGILAIFDADGVYLGNLIAPGFGSRTSELPSFWEIIQAEGFVGYRHTLRTREFPDRTRTFAHDLPNGTYYIQFYLFDYFVSDPWRIEPGNSNRYYYKIMKPSVDQPRDPDKPVSSAPMYEHLAKWRARYPGHLVTATPPVRFVLQ